MMVLFSNLSFLMNIVFFSHRNAFFPAGFFTSYEGFF